MKKKSKEQELIDQKLAKRKAWLKANYPLCIFCGHKIRNEEGDLAHKIRRSYASSKYSRFELQTMDKNTGLAHRECHEIFDNDVEGAKLLPCYEMVLEDIKEIDYDYYLLIKD